MRTLRSTVVFALIITGALTSCRSPHQVNRWEPAIRQFEKADSLAPPPAAAVVFLGSSSIRGWSTLATDFPFTPVINRGFGGSEMADLVLFYDRIVRPCQPRLLVVYAGDNDLVNGRTPVQIAADFQRLVNKSRKPSRGLPVIVLSVKPSPARWSVVDAVRETNRLLADMADQDEHIFFVDLFSAMLNPNQRPRPELFRADSLHLNQTGYQLWAAQLTPVIRSALRLSAE